MKKNRDYKNSKGISSKEYRLGSRAGRAQNRDRQMDFDYLDKLSPEEFAWLAEFNANHLSGEFADPTIVGEETAALLNTKQAKRNAQNAENARRRSVHNREGMEINEAILEYVDVQNQQRWNEADASIEIEWKKRAREKTYKKLKNNS